MPASSDGSGQAQYLYIINFRYITEIVKAKDIKWSLSIYKLPAIQKA